MTKAEKEWCDRIVNFGCIACWLDGYSGTPAEIHHILSGGRRKGHMFTIPLCSPGHHRNGGDRKISRHPFKTRFVNRYGNEYFLLNLTREQVGSDIVIPASEQNQSVRNV